MSDGKEESSAAKARGTAFLKAGAYDKAADANWLRDALQDLHMELITPHRRTAPAPAVKTFEVYDDTDNDGTLNTRSAGCLTPHDFSSGTNAAHSCSKNSFTWYNLLLY